MSKPVSLCSKCAALYASAYIVKKVGGGVDAKVDCESCKRHRFGGTYEIMNRKSPKQP